MNKKASLQSGVTLIEVIIYVALLSFVISGALVSVYQMLSGTDRLSYKNITEEEALFIISKIEWSLNNVSLVNSPLPNTSGAALSVTRNGYASNPIDFSLAGNDITIEKNNAGPIILNSDRVSISTLSFEFTRQTGAGTADSIRASFYANGEYFETYKYLR